MNAKPVFVMISLLAMVLAACSPAPTAAPAATGVPVMQRVVVPGSAQTSVVMATAAPQPTRVPEGMPQPTPTFEDYGVNPYVDAAVDNLSTFALDVDTASYTVMRRYITSGQLPPREAVRVEEFVNYFDQDYVGPITSGFSLYADGALSPFHTDGTYILRFGIQGYQVSEQERPPAVLTFVIDESGSMADNGKLELVKQSLRLLVERLRPDDTVAIVAYTTDARIVLHPTSGESRAAVLDAIYALEPRQTTNVEDGLLLGYQLAEQAFRPGAINRVILCSDGVANTGATLPNAILDSIGAYAQRDITLTAIGVGMGEFNDALLEQLADKGNGHYAYIDDLDEAQRLFVEDLTSTLMVIALNAKAQVDFNSQVVARYRLIGYENRAVADDDFRNDKVDAGEIGAGHSVTALYAVQFQPAATGRVATLQLRWEEPETHVVHEIAGMVNTWDLPQVFDTALARFQLDAVVMQYAEVLRGSPYAEGTTLSLLAEHAQRVATLLPEDKDVVEFAQLVRRAAETAR
jgi:Ca-activated chloride channel family protein